jgi:hypothetical protein
MSTMHAFAALATREPDCTAEDERDCVGSYTDTARPRHSATVRQLSQHESESQAARKSFRRPFLLIPT